MDTYRQELGKFKDRKQCVLTLFIDGNLTFDEKVAQTTKIASDILRTELKLNQANDDVVSTEVLVDFSINMIQNAAKLWIIANDV